MLLWSNVKEKKSDNKVMDWESEGAEAVRRSYVSYQGDYLVDLWLLNLRIGPIERQFPPIWDHCLRELVPNPTWPLKVTFNPHCAGSDVPESGATHFCHRAGVFLTGDTKQNILMIFENGRPPQHLDSPGDHPPPPLFPFWFFTFHLCPPPPLASLTRPEIGGQSCPGRCAHQMIAGGGILC